MAKQTSPQLLNYGVYLFLLIHFIAATSTSDEKFVFKEQAKNSGLFSGSLNDAQGRITNGREIKITEAPYYIQISNHHHQLFCGGTLVSPLTVITAAHCVHNKLKNQMKIIAKADKINEGGQVRKVQEYFIHPDYNPKTWHADVAVIKADTPFNTTVRGVSPVLMCSEPLHDKEDIQIVGWGQTNENTKKATEHLQSITVKGISYESCYGLMNITETMVCNDVRNGKDACQSDSGGPAILVTKQCLTGIVSWGRGCGHNGTPGVLTSITTVRSFIRDSRTYERKTKKGSKA